MKVIILQGKCKHKDQSLLRKFEPPTSSNYKGKEKLKNIFSESCLVKLHGGFPPFCLLVPL